MTDNIYRPYMMRIDSVCDETPDVRTLRLVFSDEAQGREFSFQAGQFGLYSAFGEGEATFCIASPPTRPGAIECSFKLAGRVTTALRRLEPGDTIGFRGPYGNWFPIEEMKGKDILFAAGGIGLAPLRSLLLNCLDRRAEFGRLTLVYGARSVADLVYKAELEEWAARGDIEVVTAVDPGGETADWQGKVGFVPAVVKECAPRADIAIVCGPPIMIKFTLPVLLDLGFAPEGIYTTLENRMKCGIGKCGRCNVGGTYVCKDGPVFSYAALQQMPDEY